MSTRAKRAAKVARGRQPIEIHMALEQMRGARTRLRDCGCKRAAEYLSRAIKSAEGAYRHAQGMARRPVEGV